MQLKAISWNIWVSGYFNQISDFLKTANADIIGLQEVQADKPDLDIINYLERLGYYHVFSPIKSFWDNQEWNYGPAIFSKYEIINSQIHKLSRQKDHLAVQADINVNGKILHVFNTHIIHTHQQQSDIQDEQISNLIKLLPKKNTILMGDFNAISDSSVVQSVKKVLVETDPKAQPTAFVYPAECCNIESVAIKLDYIFTSKDIKTKGFRVGESKGSDHLPISVTVLI